MHADRIIKKSEFRPCNRSISRQQPARRPASHFLVTPGSRPPIHDSSSSSAAAAAGSAAAKAKGPAAHRPQLPTPHLVEMGSTDADHAYLDSLGNQSGASPLPPAPLPSTLLLKSRGAEATIVCICGHSAREGCTHSIHGGKGAWGGKVTGGEVGGPLVGYA
jgi:hypothetical protein